MFNHAALIKQCVLVLLLLFYLLLDQKMANTHRAPVVPVCAHCCGADGANPSLTTVSCHNHRPGNLSATKP